MALLANHLTPPHRVSLLSTGSRWTQAGAGAKVFPVNQALATRTSSEEPRPRYGSENEEKNSTAAAEGLVKNRDVFTRVNKNDRVTQ